MTEKKKEKKIYIVVQRMSKLIRLEEDRHAGRNNSQKETETDRNRHTHRHKEGGGDRQRHREGEGGGDRQRHKEGDRHRHIGRKKGETETVTKKS